MKRSILLISLTLFVATLFGQNKTQGTFASHDPYNWTCIKFYSDSLFTYSCWGCKGGAESKGVYKINGENLTLYYISNDTLKDYSTEKISCPPSDNNYFNSYQLRFKNGDTQEYKIKEFNSDKIILAQGKNDLHFWRKEN